MRLIGHNKEKSAAHLFADFLYVQGIENQIEKEPDGWRIWIADGVIITVVAGGRTAAASRD